MTCGAFPIWMKSSRGKFHRQSQPDGLWGVYRFKRGFGGQVLRSVGAWDRIYSPSIFQIYLRIRNSVPAGGVNMAHYCYQCGTALQPGFD
jgi:hypothetical protein